MQLPGLATCFAAGACVLFSVPLVHATNLPGFLSTHLDLLKTTDNAAQASEVLESCTRFGFAEMDYNRVHLKVAMYSGEMATVREQLSTFHRFPQPIGFLSAVAHQQREHTIANSPGRPRMNRSSNTPTLCATSLRTTFSLPCPYT